MADEEKEVAEKEIESAVPKEKASKNSLLTIVMILNTVLMGTVGYLQYMSFQAEKNRPSLADLLKEQKKDVEGETEDTGEGPEEDGILFPLQNFTANLAQGDGPRRYVRLTAVLKFSKDSSEEEFKARKPQIRDSIIGTLNSKRPEDLMKLEGKNFLKEEIKSAINTFLVDGEVIDVFYVGFQIN